MGNISHYWEDKEERKKVAAAHTKKMSETYADEIRACAINTKIYSKEIYGLTEKEPKDIPIELVPLDTVAAASKYHEGKTMMLNFASYKNPGGGFMNGSKAQEECLCHESYLYNVLSQKQDYYDWNLKHLNRALYTNRAMYSPGVRFPFGLCDVLTCASPNYTTAAKYQDVSVEENNKVLRDRIKFILDICELQHCETLILGAFGCGVFGQNGRTVCKYFCDLIPNYSFKKIIFAVPKGKYDRNYEAFEEYLNE